MACCPVHSHSEFSSLDGFGQPDEIAESLIRVGAHGGAITDHGTVAGWEVFDKALRSHDLKPVFGIEAYQAKVHRKTVPEKKKRDAAHLILLAENNEGLRNIRIMSDFANREGFYYSPRLDWELLEKYIEGVICTTACMSSLVCQGLKTFWEPEEAEE